MVAESAVKRLDFATFDVFTQERLKGNPLAVVKVAKDCALDQDTKQAIAREFNFSETVFLHQAEDASKLDRMIDIFTTTEELPFAGGNSDTLRSLCSNANSKPSTGHPTIGSICCIGRNIAANAAQAFTLKTKAGPILAAYHQETSSAIAEIPHDVRIHSSKLTRTNVQSLCPFGGTDTSDNLLSRWPRGTSGDFLEFFVVSIVKGMTFILIELPDVENYLARLQADRQLRYANVVALDESWAPSFIAPYYFTILSQSDSQSTRVRSRMIEPRIGEDPATGSAACALGAFLALRSGRSDSTHHFHVEQGVEMGRTSEIGVEVRLTEDGKTVDKISLSGSAVQVTEGTLMI